MGSGGIEMSQREDAAEKKAEGEGEVIIVVEQFVKKKRFHIFFFQAETGIRGPPRSRGLGNVY